MHFVKSGKKLSFSFLTLIVVLLSIVSIAFAEINSSANSNVEEKSPSADSQNRQTFYISNIFTGNSIAQTLSNLFSGQPEQVEIADSPVFEEFDAWINTYVNNDYKASSEQLNFGENLAVKRKELLKQLIQINPQAAVEKSIPAETFNRLPSFITENSEKHISAYGDLWVYAIDESDAESGKMKGSHMERAVVIGDSRYKAFVYGRRETMTTKFNIPLQGIVIDDTIAVDENPIQKINSAEYANSKVDKSKISAESIVAEVGGKVVYFSNQSEFNNFVREQIEWESKIGPVRPPENLAPNEAASSWTEGPKTVLVIRVDFSDKAGEPLDFYNQPLTLARAQSLFNGEINSFYVNSSYGKTSMAATVSTVVRLPQTFAYYTQGSNYNVMLSDARIAARAAGFDTNNFNLDVVTFSYTQNIGWAGIAAIGAKSAMLNGAFFVQEGSHELGHNYGLLHANLWRTIDGTVAGAGNSIEYGDCYDDMGACVNQSANSYFNTRYKLLLNWLTDADVQTVTSSGTYRIFAQDTPSLGGIRTLKITRDTTSNYWVEFRQLMGGNSLNGALIRWDTAGGSSSQTQLLDMNPSTTSVADAPLLVGQSFYDANNQVKITILGKAGTTPESLDVKVELGSGTTPTPTVTPTPTPSCTYSISPVSQSFASTGGSGSINVTTASGCNWSAGSNQSFVSLTSGNNGSGSGTINYSVAANTTGNARTALITIGGQIFTVQQAAAAVGNYTLAASPTTVSAGDQITVSFTAPAGSSSLDWVGIYKIGAVNSQYVDGGYTNGAASGNFTLPAPTQAGQYEFRYLLNNSFTSVATSNIVTVQSAPTPNCTYSITPTSRNFDSAGGTNSLNVTTLDGCAWTAASNVSWITISGTSSGTGAGTISFTVEPNGISPRTGTISVGGQTFIVSQASAIVSSNRNTAFDFDGDGKADISVYRPSNGGWYLLNSTSGFTATQFGAATDKVVSADFDGDGKTDVAVYRDGVWYIQRSTLGFTGITFGLPTDIPMPADFDGDGRAELAVFRPSNGGWYIYNLSSNQFTSVQFGQNGDVPVAADYDGDGKADIAVFRNGTWYIQRSRDGFVGIGFGQIGDKPVPADYDGDGKTDIAVFRPENGGWYLQQSTNGFIGIQFGISSDKPAPADYDGDGKADLAVFRSGTWYIQKSASGFTGIAFGETNDKPIPNAFIP